MGALWAGAAGAAAAQVPEAARESEGESAWEFGVTAGALRVDEGIALDVEEGWRPAVGGRLAWRPVLLAALGIEAWRAELETVPSDSAPSESRDLWALAALFRVTPSAGRGWLLDPALHFGIEHLSVDDDEERGLAFVAGAGLVRISSRWTLGVAVRNHHLSVEEEPFVPEEGPPVETARDADLWEVRAEVAIALGGQGG